MKNKKLKSIKYIYHKRKVENLVNQKKTKSLCFLSQGLDSKELSRLKDLMNRLDLNLTKISKRSWTKLFLDNEGKEVRKKAYGDLFLLENKSRINGKPWLPFFYHQILNYSSYRFFNKKSNYNIKSDNLFIDSIFPLDLGKESIQSFVQDFHLTLEKKKLPSSSKFIYPWDCISSEENQPTCSNLKNSEIQLDENYVNFVQEWNKREGHPANVLISYIVSNHFQFLGCIDDSASIQFDNYLNFDANDLNFSSKVNLNKLTLNYLNHFGDSYYLKLSPLNSCYMVYL